MNGQDLTPWHRFFRFFNPTKLDLGIPPHLGHGEQWDERGWLDILSQLRRPSEAWAQDLMQRMAQEREARGAAAYGGENVTYLLPGEDPREGLERGPVEYSLIPPGAASLLQRSAGQPVPVPLAALLPSPAPPSTAGAERAPSELDALLRLLLSPGEGAPPPGTTVPPGASPPAASPQPPVPPQIMPQRLYREQRGNTVFFGNAPRRWPR